MRLDLHIHSTHSPDGTVSPRDILKIAKKRKLGGVAITDHNSLKGSFEARSLAKEFGLVVVRGVEISTDIGHVLAYAIDEEIPRDLSVEETVARVRKVGGFASIAHPYRWWSGVGERATVRSKPDAVEVMNAGSTGMHNRMAMRLSKRMKVCRTAGSDAHVPEGIGRAYISIENAESEEDVLEAIGKGRVKTSGKSRTAPESVQYGYEVITAWAKRGFKRM
jgi:predicted metal-dependent phosphoesterase TrpH